MRDEVCDVDAVFKNIEFVVFIVRMTTSAGVVGGADRVDSI